MTVSLFYFISIRYLFDSFFPFTTIRMRQCEPPWMTIALKVLINDKDKAFRRKEHLKFHRLCEKVMKQIKFLQSTYLRNAAVW